MYMNAYHKDQGEVRMFEVDARNAIARFPDEWSAEPWQEVSAADAPAGKRGRTKKGDGSQNDGDVSGAAEGESGDGNKGDVSGSSEDGQSSA